MEKASEESMESPSMMTYVIGAVLIVAVVSGAWYFRSKSATKPMVEPTGQPVVVTTPASEPITKLGCDQQYYNPKVAFPEYYLSVEGGDISTAKSVSCEFSVSVDGKEVGNTTVTSPLTPAPERGGSTFRCTTQSMKLTPNVSTVVDVVLKDDLKANSSCSATFTFQ